MSNMADNRVASSVNSLVGNNSPSYESLMKNVSDGYNMGEIVFAKGAKSGTFTRVNNHVGCMSFLNNVITTAEQNRATNAAVFKALLSKYGNANGANNDGILNTALSTLSSDQVPNLFQGMTNPYLKEAFNYLLLENHSAPLSRDELKMLDELLARGRGGAENNDVRTNMGLLKDLKAMKSGAKEVIFENADKQSKAEHWISGLRVSNLKNKEYRRLITETVNQRYAAELEAFKKQNPGHPHEDSPIMQFFKHMPGLVNTINGNVIDALKLGVEKWDNQRWMGRNVDAKDVGKLLKLLLVNVETKFKGACEATNKFQASSKFKAADIKAFMYKYMAERLLCQYPVLKNASVISAFENYKTLKAGEEEKPLVEAILNLVNEQQPGENKADENNKIVDVDKTTKEEITGDNNEEIKKEITGDNKKEIKEEKNEKPDNNIIIDNNNIIDNSNIINNNIIINNDSIGDINPEGINEVINADVISNENVISVEADVPVAVDNDKATREKTRLGYVLFDEIKEFVEANNNPTAADVENFINEKADKKTGYNLSAEQKSEFAIKTALYLETEDKISKDDTGKIFEHFGIKEKDGQVAQVRQLIKFDELTRGNYKSLLWASALEDLPDITKLLMFLEVGFDRVAVQDSEHYSEEFAAFAAPACTYMALSIPSALEKIRKQQPKGPISIESWWKALGLGNKLWDRTGKSLVYDGTIQDYVDIMVSAKVNKNTKAFSDKAQDGCVAFYHAIRDKFLKDLSISGLSESDFIRTMSSSRLRIEELLRLQTDRGSAPDLLDYLGKPQPKSYPSFASADAYAKDTTNGDKQKAFLEGSHVFDSRHVGVQYVFNGRHFHTIENQYTDDERKKVFDDLTKLKVLTPRQVTTMGHLMNSYESDIAQDFGCGGTDDNRTRIEVNSIPGSQDVELTMVCACMDKSLKSLGHSGDMSNDTGVRIKHTYTLCADGKLIHKSLRFLNERTASEQDMVMFANFARANKQAKERAIHLVPGCNRRLEITDKITIEENQEVRGRLQAFLNEHYANKIPESLQFVMGGSQGSLTVEDIGKVMNLVKEEDLKDNGWMDREIDKCAKQFVAEHRPLTVRDLDLFLGHVNGWLDLEPAEKRKVAAKLIEKVSGETPAEFFSPEVKRYAKKFTPGRNDLTIKHLEEFLAQMGKWMDLDEAGRKKLATELISAIYGELKPTEWLDQTVENYAKSAKFPPDRMTLERFRRIGECFGLSWSQNRENALKLIALVYRRDIQNPDVEVVARAENRLSHQLRLIGATKADLLEVESKINANSINNINSINDANSIEGKKNLGLAGGAAKDEEVRKRTTRLGYVLYDEMSRFESTLPKDGDKNLATDKVLNFVKDCADKYHLTPRQRMDFVVKTAFFLKSKRRTLKTAEVFSRAGIDEKAPEVANAIKVLKDLDFISRDVDIARIMMSSSLKDIPEVFKLIKFLDITVNRIDEIEWKDPWKNDFKKRHQKFSSFAKIILHKEIPEALEKIRAKKPHGKILMSEWWSALKFGNKFPSKSKTWYDKVDTSRFEGLLKPRVFSIPTQDKTVADVSKMFYLALYARIKEDYREFSGLQKKDTYITDDDLSQADDKILGYAYVLSTSKVRNDAIQRMMMDRWFLPEESDYLSTCESNGKPSFEDADEVDRNPHNKEKVKGFKDNIAAGVFDSRQMGLQYLIDGRHVCTVEAPVSDAIKDQTFEKLKTHLTSRQMKRLAHVYNEHDAFLAREFGFAADWHRSHVEVMTIPGSQDVKIKMVSACQRRDLSKKDGMTKGVVGDDTGIRIVHDYILRKDGSLEHQRLRFESEWTDAEQDLAMFASLAKEANDEKASVRLVPGSSRRLETSKSFGKPDNKEIHKRLFNCLAKHCGGHRDNAFAPYALTRTEDKEKDRKAMMEGPLTVETLRKIMADVKKVDLKKGKWVDQEVRKYADILASTGRSLTYLDVDIFLKHVNGWLDLTPDEKKNVASRLITACGMTAADFRNQEIERLAQQIVLTEKPLALDDLQRLNDQVLERLNLSQKERCDSVLQLISKVYGAREVTLELPRVDKLKSDDLGTIMSEVKRVGLGDNGPVDQEIDKSANKIQAEKLENKTRQLTSDDVDDFLARVNKLFALNQVETQTVVTKLLKKCGLTRDQFIELEINRRVKEAHANEKAFGIYDITLFDRNVLSRFGLKREVKIEWALTLIESLCKKWGMELPRPKQEDLDRIKELGGVATAVQCAASNDGWLDKEITKYLATKNKNTPLTYEEVDAFVKKIDRVVAGLNHDVSAWHLVEKHGMEHGVEHGVEIEDFIAQQIARRTDEIVNGKRSLDINELSNLRTMVRSWFGRNGSEQDTTALKLIASVLIKGVELEPDVKANLLNSIHKTDADLDAMVKEIRKKDEKSEGKGKNAEKLV